MAQGAGKYDPECTAVLVNTNAAGVALIIIGGDRGTGFSINLRDPKLETALPLLLRQMADVIEGVS